MNLKQNMMIYLQLCRNPTSKSGTHYKVECEDGSESLRACIDGEWSDLQPCPDSKYIFFIWKKKTSSMTSVAIFLSRIDSRLQ